MSFDVEQREARRILEGIENGLMTTSDSWNLIETADPTLIYFIITWLRNRYANDAASEGVLGRVIALQKSHPQLGQILKTGEQDAVVDWFEDTYQYRELDADEFIQIVVEKLEG